MGVGGGADAGHQRDADAAAHQADDGFDALRVVHDAGRESGTLAGQGDDGLQGGGAGLREGDEDMVLQVFQFQRPLLGQDVARRQHGDQLVVFGRDADIGADAG
ncbi:hypothetical protein D9M68_873450 [compost metagenome]